MATDAQPVVMTVPKDVLEAHITAAVARALGADQKALIEAVVTAAFQAKKDHYSTSRTIFQEKVDELIRASAVLAFQAELEDWKPEIVKAVRARLAPMRGQYLKDMVDRFTKALENFSVNISLRER